MKLIVGLGNPGKEYEHTRHNVGFFMLEKYLAKSDLLLHKKKFNGLYVETLIHGEKTIFLEPQSYMNLSGEVIRRFVDFYKISLEDILIICDDTSLKVGNLRIRGQGTTAGHNGLKNIEQNLQTQAYKRLRIGIDKPDKMELKDYVLGKFSLEDQKVLEDLSIQVCQILDDFFVKDFASLMNQYNHRQRG